MKYSTPEIPYVESHYHGGKQKPTAIIITPSFTTSKKGAALGLARRWHSISAPYNTGHYVVDEQKRYRTTFDKEIAGAVGSTDKNAIRITVCAEPSDQTFFWDLNNHKSVLRETARLVAELCLAYDIKERLLYSEDMRRWERWRSKRRGGIYINTPGEFPYEDFLAEIRVQMILKTFI